MICFFRKRLLLTLTNLTSLCWYTYWNIYVVLIKNVNGGKRRTTTIYPKLKLVRLQILLGFGMSEMRYITFTMSWTLSLNVIYNKLTDVDSYMPYLKRRKFFINSWVLHINTVFISVAFENTYCSFAKLVVVIVLIDNKILMWLLCIFFFM